MSLHTLFVILIPLLWQEVSMEDCKKLNVTEIALRPNEKPFPLSEFLDASGINSSAIQWRGLQCKKWLQKGECQCDVGCQSSGNCCIDFLWDQFAFNNESVAQNVKSYQQKVIKSSKSQRCLPLFPFAKEIEEYYIMVDSCVPGANKTDIGRCFNSSSNNRVDQMPALGNDKFLYKNKFCAQCNNIYNYSTKDIVDVTCDQAHNFMHENPTAIELLKSGCSTKASEKVNKKSVLKCQRNRCSQLDSTLCRLIAAKALIPAISLFENPFCYRCLKDLPNTIGVSSCEYSLCPTCSIDGHGDWSRVIDLNDFDKEITCGINQFINRKGHNIHCERKTCGFNAALIDGECKYCGRMAKIFRQNDNRDDICVCELG